MPQPPKFQPPSQPGGAKHTSGPFFCRHWASNNIFCWRSKGFRAGAAARAYYCPTLPVLCSSPWYVNIVKLTPERCFQNYHHLPCYCTSSYVFICKRFHLLRPRFVFTSDKHTLKAVHYYLWIRLNSGKATLKAGTEATADETGAEETGSAFVPWKPLWVKPW